MLKLLTFVLVIYLSYKFWFQPNQIDKSGQQDSGRQINENENGKDNGEYIDYEEVD